ncbi:hypothetical protein QUG22_20035 [Escherichia coli]|nr:hypothetical protein [Escherichia coli]MDM6721767.1 hypothetical protein [Escherichia coli]
MFQAAEEGVCGAKPIAEGGILDDRDYFLSAHIGMGVPTGNVVASPTDLLCTTKLDFFFYGTPAHAGVNPHLGNNALAAACHCTIQLLAIPRHGEWYVQDKYWYSERRRRPEHNPVFCKDAA